MQYLVGAMGGAARYDAITRDLMRALRGTRSQQKLARLLGVHKASISDWETGRRAPTATQVLTACAALGLPVQQALVAGLPFFVRPPADFSRQSIARMLDHSRGDVPLGELCARGPYSRHALGRWFAGKSAVRFPELLGLVDLLTGRAMHFVFVLGLAEHMPSVQQSYRRWRDAQDARLAEPWAAAVHLAMRTSQYQALPRHEPGWLAQALGIDLATERRCLEVLKRAGMIERSGERYVYVLNPLLGYMHVRGDAEAARGFYAHWMLVGHDRFVRRKVGSGVAQNGRFALTPDQWTRMRAVLEAAMTEIAAIADELPQRDVERTIVGLINTQMVCLME